MAEVSVFELQTPKQKVLMAARDGMAISILDMLWNLDRDSIVQEVLNNKTEEHEQNITPLISAARKVVEVLLRNFDADIEQTGTVKFDSYDIEGAAALWCAAGVGHFGVVMLLVEHRSNVNHPTQANSTPLRAA